jgi:hypothetical protein
MRGLVRSRSTDGGVWDVLELALVLKKRGEWAGGGKFV